MTPNEILTSSPLDLLFQNRNKQYGAYVLRRYYNNRLWISLGITLSILPLLFFIFQGDESANEERPKGETVILKEYTLPKKIKEPVIKPQKISTQKPAPAQKRFINRLEIVPNNKVVPHFTLQDELNGVQPGTSTQQGVPSSGLAVESHPVVSEVASSKPDPAPMLNSEPEYPGGTKAWLAFLQKNLRVPGELGEGEKKTVVVRFQVSTEGVVTGFEISQSAGNVYDNEVIRVLKKMPRWKPAIQNNIPVARYFTQPVTFMGVSE